MAVLRRHASRDKGLRETYMCISGIVKKNRLPVQLPRLCTHSHTNSYTVTSLMLIYFYKNLGKVRTISDLKAFLVAHGCGSINPQPRHLGMQRGFRFLVHNCVHPGLGRPLQRGEYCLLDLQSAHPSASSQHRDRTKMLTDKSFQRMCVSFDYRCAVCGSKKGDAHFKNRLLSTTIERGHADPRRPLTQRNCIPMCRLCNCVYKNNVVFNKRGMMTRWLGKKTA